MTTAGYDTRPASGGVIFCCHFTYIMAIHQYRRCIVNNHKRARTRSRYSSVEAEQEHKGRIVLARELRRQKGKNRPEWTIRGLAQRYTSQELIQMLGSVRFPY